MGEPLYRQIADDLRRKIESGELSPGGRLPTELELRRHYRASRNTVRDALRWLSARGLVASRHGRGTFVADEVAPLTVTLSADPATGLAGGEEAAYVSEVRAHRRDPGLSAPRVEIHNASSGVAAHLRLERGSQVISRSQQRFVDGEPWSVQTSFYPMRFVDLGARRLLDAANVDGGVLSYLRDTLGIEQAGYRDTLIVRPPTETEAAFFRISGERVVMVETDRTAYDVNGRPFRFTVTVYPADRNSFAINVGSVPQEDTTPSGARAEASLRSRAASMAAAY